MSRVVDIATSRVRNFMAFQRNPLGFLVKILHHGDVISLRSGRLRPTYIVNSPEFIKEILVGKEASFVKGRSSSVLRRTLGDGLLTSENGTHQKQRQYMQPVFYKERLEAYAGVVLEEAGRLADRLPLGETVSLSDEMMGLTLSIMARTMFATDLKERKQELAAAVSVTIERSARTLFSPLILPLAVPTPGNIVHRRAIRSLESMIYDVIKEARSNPERFRLTLLGLLMDTTDDRGRGIPDEEIRDHMMTMLLAGHETTANLLTWIWHVLDRQPEVEARFHAELDTVDLTGASPMEAFRSLTYTNLIVQEALRMYPPAWIILREAEREVTMLGEAFPAGSAFMFSPYAIHRNGKVFKDPLSFRPERFAQGTGGWLRYSYFPFGGGARSCIGANFALMEASLLLACLGQKFRFRRTEKRQVQAEPLVSLRVRGGLRMTAERRS